MAGQPPVVDHHDGSYSTPFYGIEKSMLKIQPWEKFAAEKQKIGFTWTDKD
jgi:hypothetical protein